MPLSPSDESVCESPDCVPGAVASPVGSEPLSDGEVERIDGVADGEVEGASVWYSSSALVSTGTLAETPSAPEYEKYVLTSEPGTTSEASNRTAFESATCEP